MKIFLSYASEDKDTAEQIYLTLVGVGHKVFFDHTNLHAGGGYHTPIQDAVNQCDFFIFLISPESISNTSFALTELNFARDKWEHPEGHVLPVIIRETAFDLIPPYLKAVTILEPEGNTPAEVAKSVALLKRRRLRELKRIGIAVALVLLISLSVGIWFFRPYRADVAANNNNSATVTPTTTPVPAPSQLSDPATNKSAQNNAGPMRVTIEPKQDKNPPAAKLPRPQREPSVAKKQTPGTIIKNDPSTGTVVVETQDTVITIHAPTVIVYVNKPPGNSVIELPALAVEATVLVDGKEYKGRKEGLDNFIFPPIPCDSKTAKHKEIAVKVEYDFGNHRESKQLIDCTQPQNNIKLTDPDKNPY